MGPDKMFQDAGKDGQWEKSKNLPRTAVYSSKHHALAQDEVLKAIKERTIDTSKSMILVQAGPKNFCVFAVFKHYGWDKNCKIYDVKLKDFKTKLAADAD